MHKKKELARLFYRELLKINNNQLDSAAKSAALFQLLQLLFQEVTKEERIQFTTFFARVAFVCHQHNLEKALQFRLHAFRKSVSTSGQSAVDSAAELVQLGIKVVAECVEALFETAMPEEVETIVPDYIRIQYSEVKVQSFQKKVRVVVLEDDETNDQFIAQTEEQPAEKIRIQYNIAHRNENFNPSIRELRNTFGFPTTLNLLDVEIDVKGIYRPRAFVIEPDFLVDVSGISECFREFGTEPALYLLKKFLPFESTKYLMIGNIANFFLDELMSNPDATFQKTFPKVFQLNPLAFVLFENALVREIMQTSQKHFLNLKRLIWQDFEKFGIEPQACYLEPSFFSETYGIQGRLDIFLNKGKDSAIIELKSGKAYMPNRYGISNNHFTQTLLYDLIVKAVFDQTVEPTNYILYSGLDQRQLRFAPVIKAQQYEAIQLRNQLVASEKKLAKVGTPEDVKILPRLVPGRFPKLKGFSQKDLIAFEKGYSGMSDLERQYFNAFVGFTAREHQLAKMGVQGRDKANGLAALWLHNMEEKERNFEVIRHLKIQENRSQENDPFLTFEKTTQTNPLANFRKGDIAVLYPAEARQDAVLHHQIFKCTIIDITPEQVVARLRYKQFNQSIFEGHEFWNLEHDMMDNSFLAMYRGLFQFAKSDKIYKARILTQTPPQRPQLIDIQPPAELTAEQKSILQQALSARDYFLLWGPPGTGKTSKMLKHLVHWLREKTDENILVLAYTNRAVDEICEAILETVTEQDYTKSTDTKPAFLRIGSRYGTAARFQKYLLSQQLEQVNNRKALREILEGHRVFVGTVSSFASKTELLKLKKFNRVIIDEASQILEPSLVGLLSNFERFILIGDHKQLPAVVVQDAQVSKVELEPLKEIGLHNLRNSLFERLYKRCQAENWDWAFAKLSHQGRMHRDIMAFPNTHFYGGFLKILPESIPFSKYQKILLQHELPDLPTELDKTLTRQRILFFNTPTDERSLTRKTNVHEAELLAILIARFLKIYQQNQRVINQKTIGIITPYRAQIAQIQEVLHQKEIDTNLLTIDTVERYQGGARDIILLSLCTNSVTQLDALVSLSEEGVDRKLNVALTRAREQVLILGNEKILKESAVYAKLIAFCEACGAKLES